MKAKFLTTLLILMVFCYNLFSNDCKYTLYTINDTTVSCSDSVTLNVKTASYYVVNKLTNESFWFIDACNINRDTFAILSSDKIYISIDGGVTFNSKSFPSNFSGRIIQRYLSNTLLITDQESMVYKTDDFGKTWDSISISGFLTFSIIDLQNFYATKWDGCYSSTDGGKTWQLKSTYKVSTTSVHVYFINSKIGFMVENNQISRTIDGGINWSNTNINMLNVIISVRL